MLGFSEIFRQSISKAGTMRVKSALNPFLWACLIVPPLCWYAAWVFQADVILLRTLVLSGLIPVVLLAVAGLRFTFCDPSRLQSEEYQIKHQTLNLIEKKGGKIVLNSDALVEIANPAAPLIENKGGKDA